MLEARRWYPRWVRRLDRLPTLLGWMLGIPLGAGVAAVAFSMGDGLGLLGVGLLLIAAAGLAHLARPVARRIAEQLGEEVGAGPQEHEAKGSSRTASSSP